MKKLLLISLFCGLPTIALGARLYFAPDKISAPPGEPFEATVFLDPAGEKINAFEGEISFPLDHLELTEISDADSIASVWLEKPHLEEDRIRFAGIIPGGFSGVLSSFYDGGQPGKLFRLIFIGRDRQSSNEVKVTWQAAQALLNDGTGQAAVLTTTGLVVKLALDATNSSPVTTQAPDNDPPASFVPELGRAPSLFGNRWFVVFGTRDTGSGIAGYQIQEHREPVPSSAKWREATSPTELNDQYLNNYISIRALDRAGNERIVTLPPRHVADFYGARILWLIMLLCAVALFYYFYFSRRRS